MKAAEELVEESIDETLLAKVERLEIFSLGNTKRLWNGQADKGAVRSKTRGHGLFGRGRGGRSGEEAVGSP